MRQYGGTQSMFILKRKKLENINLKPKIFPCLTSHPLALSNFESKYVLTVFWAVM